MNQVQARIRRNSGVALRGDPDSEDHYVESWRMAAVALLVLIVGGALFLIWQKMASV